MSKRPRKDTLPARPSLVDAVKAAGPARARGWDFTPEQRAEIEQVRAEMAAGRLYITAVGLSRLLRERYTLPVGDRTIAARLAQIAGGKW